MLKDHNFLQGFIVLLFLIAGTPSIMAQITPVGLGGYTNSFPGVDAANRNEYPSGTPQVSGAANGKPVPTNDWWSSLIKSDHVSNLFNYPMALKTINPGLVVSYIPWGVYDDQEPVVVGVTGLNASKATVANYSDWTVTMDWTDGSHNLQATSGIGMPFLYFNKANSDIAQITVNLGQVIIDGEMLIVTDARNDADFAFYAPAGSTWTQSGSRYTSNLNNKNYWSMAMIPLTATNVGTVAEEYKKYAYVFPQNTTTTWVYDESNSVMRTNFVVTPEVKEGTDTNVLLGLLPHQWANLSDDSSTPNKYEYSSVRGVLKTMDGNTFSVENTYKGILPALPYLANYSEEFSPSELDKKNAQIENDGLATWTDSYNEGQVMNRLIQTARIADQMGNTEARDKMVATVKERLEDWLKAESSEVAFLFYYNSDWSTLIGYPAGHGQDGNINDHHFHWGYFIHAASFLEQFEPGWSDQWGDMINLLVRDAASPDRSDTQFPFLRNFSPYAGHCWANGFATFPQGNDQESTSESMQFNSSLIHWGTITGNDEIRDLGIYLYTTEQTAIEEYWFDMYERNFSSSQQYSLVSRVWGNSYDNGTFWTADIAASYGIEMYPIHGGSLYLGHNTGYVQKLWNEISANTGILRNEENPNLWHDIMWEYLSFVDPQRAIDLYNSNPDRSLKFGVSDAQTYHWIHSMNAIGNVNSSITSDYPIAAAFNKNGEITYVAHNYSNIPITVNFSDGYLLDVPAYKMATSRDVDVSGVLTSDFNQAYVNGSVNLSVATTGNGITKVEFYDGNDLIGEKLVPPYEIEALNLSLGVHGMYAKVFVNDEFNTTNIISVQVGEQVPFLGNSFNIPGIIEAGNYDKFEGGVGQGISYVDVSQQNEGGYRPQEYVDALVDTQEGATVGWLSAGEWMEYSINVQTAGKYDFIFRYASGNANGGGPFYLEIDGNKISTDISVDYTIDWDSWASKTVNNVELNEGEHVLRLVIINGEFNIGEMAFEYSSGLGYFPPTANAGSNVVILLPATTGSLDGSLSSDPEGQELFYDWEQVYGPSIISFSDNAIASPDISNLIEGVYKCKLTVNDGTYFSHSEVLVIVSETANLIPSIAITSPANNSSFKENSDISITTSASDLDGDIALVEFYDGSTKIGEDLNEPFSLVWAGATVGNHVLTAKATDNGNAVGTSTIVNISVDEVMSCVETNTQGSQGSFSIGYKSTFATVGTYVTITFELLDNDKSGVVAFLWQESPFAEAQMEHVSGNIFSKTINNLTIGSTISYACKFAYAGGLSVTNYISYVVGSDCQDAIDVEPPVNFTAELGAITSSSIELLLNGTDNSGTVVYDVNYVASSTSLTVDSGGSESLVINALSPETQYQLSITASDLAGNTTNNSPIILNATTGANTNTECEGSTFESQNGDFEIGYSYKFETIGSDVEITFELLDDKDGVFAFLWNESPFTETVMTHVSGKIFTATIIEQTAGTPLSLACKFEFSNGLAVTKYFSYVVGNSCSDVTLGFENGTPKEMKAYPNPVVSSLNLVFSSSDKIIIHNVIDGLGRVEAIPYKIYKSRIQFDFSTVQPGLYVVLLEKNAVSDFIRVLKK